MYCNKRNIDNDGLTKTQIDGKNFKMGKKIRSNEEENPNMAELRPPKFTFLQTATFQNMMIRETRGRETPATASSPRMDDIKERKKHQIVRNAQAGHDGSLQAQDSFDESSRSTSGTIPGAVDVHGTKRVGSTIPGLDMDEDPPAMENDPERSAASYAEKLFQVEAQLIPENPNNDEIIQRVKEEVHEQLENERRLVATAEVVTPSQEAIKTVNLPRRCVFGTAAVVIVAIAISVGIVLSQSSSSDPPTPLPRETVIVNALGSQLNYSWKAQDTVQQKAFDWLARIDTLQVQNLTSRQIMERYVLAVLYFNVQPQEYGYDPLSFFLKPVSVCQWHSEDESGVTCLNDSFVSGIHLGMFRSSFLDLGKFPF